MKRNTMFFECMLLLLLLSLCVYTSCRGNERVAEAGTFTGGNMYNDTLEDFSNNIYTEFFHE